MTRIDPTVRSAGSNGHARRPEVFARLLELTRRYYPVPGSDTRAAPGSSLCDGAGFEDRLQAALAARTSVKRATTMPDRHSRGRAQEQRPRYETDGGIVAWIAVDGLEPDGSRRVSEHASDALRGLLRERIDACPGADNGTLGRYGAGSFAWMRPSPIALEQAVALAEALLDSLSTPWPIAGVAPNLHASLGIVYYPQDGANPAMLLTRACAAMRRARHYRMGYAFYSPLLDAAFTTSFGIRLQEAQNATQRTAVAGSVTARCRNPDG